MATSTAGGVRATPVPTCPLRLAFVGHRRWPLQDTSLVAQRRLQSAEAMSAAIPARRSAPAAKSA